MTNSLPQKKTIVQRVQSGDLSVQEQFYSSYCGPLGAHARRRGFVENEARQRAHDFITGVVEQTKQTIVLQWKSEKGRFRSYLLGAFDHFLNEQWRRDQALKRGGGTEEVSLDEQPSEVRDALAHTLSDEDELRFDYDWAQGIFARAMERLKARYMTRQQRFELLKACLQSDDYSALTIAGELKKPVAQIHVIVSRFRREFRECLRAEIADTVADDSDIDDEMQHLRRVLRSGSALR